MDFNVNTITAKVYYIFAGQTVAMRNGPPGTPLEDFLTDQLGSVILALDATGNPIAGTQQRYMPFGQPRFNNTPVTDFAYTGQRDLDMQGNSFSLGLMDYNARFYDDYITHFNQPDSIIPDQDNPQTLNRYVYAANNPIRYNDPSGHCFTDPFTFMLCAMAAGAIIGGVVDAVAQYQNTGHVDLGQVAQAAAGGALLVGGVVLAAVAAPVAVAGAGVAMAAAGSAIGVESVENAGVDTLASSLTLSDKLNGLFAPPAELPTLNIDLDRMPNIAENIQNAQANGAPDILTRTTDQARIAANRAAACIDFCGTGSPDEYPFASTYEGGKGAFVADVPQSEQNIQGGVLAQFYRIYGIQDGDQFKVTAQ